MVIIIKLLLLEQYLYYIKWDDKTSNDRLKLKKYNIFSKNNNKYKLIDYILISSFLLEGT